MGCGPGMSPAIEPLRLRDALPDLADELKRLLSNEGEDDIADQIDALQIVSRCNCGDDFCATFETRRGRYVESIPLDEAKDGIVVVDLDSRRRVLGVEVLYRDAYKAMLDRLMPVTRRRANKA